ncbi:hypothetical protein [Acanthopleuribacter pedis]|uniref:HEAT repeat domain-containing protein n=1 Tax=Acanthopleuribacter pedis TaxID=442870 RepID=A0A8J7U2V3_9BACT|nr:hypothetical protein [Acanthopleuribacter pedis]MBO1317668.1 hypothetical protein [Acanthopleuribacter pedis]
MDKEPNQSPLDALFEPLDDERELWREDERPEDVLAVHQRLIDAEAPHEVDDAAFARMRAGVLAEIRKAPKVASSPDKVIQPKIAHWRQPVFLLGAAAAMLLGVLIGSRFWQNSPAPIWYNPVGDAAQHGTDFRQGAARQMVSSLAQPQPDLRNLPYVYDNIAITPTPGNQVHLSFDMATHVSLVRPADDPLVREMLVNALMDRESLNNRLHAVQLSDPTMSPEVKQALVIAMRQDGELSVRLKAMAKLAPFGEEPLVSQALMEVLKNDESVQMRLNALDYLMGSNPAKGDIEALERTLRERGDTPLLMRVNRWERH